MHAADRLANPGRHRGVDDVAQDQRIEEVHLLAASEQALTQILALIELVAGA